MRYNSPLPSLGWNGPDLGLPRSQNSSTRVSFLLALSVLCNYLWGVWIHFNPTNLTHDIRFLPEDPDVHGLRQLPTRCPLKHFDAGKLRFPNVTDCDITTIVEGFMNVFPSISSIASASGTGWGTLESVYKLRGMRTGSVVRGEGASDRRASRFVASHDKWTASNWVFLA